MYKKHNLPIRNHVLLLTVVSTDKKSVIAVNYSDYLNIEMNSEYTT